MATTGLDAARQSSVRVRGAVDFTQSRSTGGTCRTFTQNQIRIFKKFAGRSCRFDFFPGTENDKSLSAWPILLFVTNEFLFCSHQFHLLVMVTSQECG